MRTKIMNLSRRPNFPIIQLFFLQLFFLEFAMTFLVPGEVIAGSNPKSNRQTVMDFEGDLVEGVNKRPWDSLSQISDKNARRRAHLYQKRKGFRTENRETLQELRYQR